MSIYELVTDHKFTKVAEFLQEHFFKYAPLGLALGLTQSQVQRWFAPFIQAILNYSDPVSYVAMDEAGNIIGVLVGVVEDPDKPYPLPTMREYLDATKEPVMLQIVTLLEQLQEGLDIRVELGQPATAKVYTGLFLSVADGWKGYGVATKLFSMGIEKAKEISGCTIAINECTSEITCKMSLKEEHKMVRELEYAKYTDPQTGVHIFEGKEAGLGYNTHARLMAKLL